LSRLAPPLARVATACAVILLAARVVAIKPDILRSSSAVAPHVAGRFRDAAGYQQSASGQYFVFDRRAHAVFGLDNERSSSFEIVQIGAEPGRIIDPTAFSVAPDGSFVVADAPGGRERIQVFTPAGFRTGGFLMPGRLKSRVVLGNAVLNGIGSLQFTGTAILLSQPETGALVAEYTLQGGVNRLMGPLRATGHEDDEEVHLALNSGIPLVDPTGGFYFVFQAGAPAFRKYDRRGTLVFERHVTGPEIDPVIAAQPTSWPKRKTSEGELPLVTPTVRTAAVDGAGRLWISFVVPYTYVYDGDGDKIRAVQFRGAGIVSPNSLFFGKNDRLLITPGLYEFQTGAGETGGAGQAGSVIQSALAVPRILPFPPILPVPRVQPVPPLPPQ
jgi:hypothetical protein